MFTFLLSFFSKSELYGLWPMLGPVPSAIAMSQLFQEVVCLQAPILQCICACTQTPQVVQLPDALAVSVI